jgi:hypothetical protein
MGRTFLSVKLAFAFGLCVSVLVLAAEQVRAGYGSEAMQIVVSPVATDEAGAVDTAAAAAMKKAPEACLWRGCPAGLEHPMLGRGVI